MTAGALLLVAIGSSIVGLLGESRDALLGGLLSSVASLILIFTGAVRSGPARRHRVR